MVVTLWLTRSVNLHSRPSSQSPTIPSSSFMVSRTLSSSINSRRDRTTTLWIRMNYPTCILLVPQAWLWTLMGQLLWAMETPQCMQGPSTSCRCSHLLRLKINNSSMMRSPDTIMKRRMTESIWARTTRISSSMSSNSTSRASTWIKLHNSRVQAQPKDQWCQLKGRTLLRLNLSHCK